MAEVPQLDLEGVGMVCFVPKITYLGAQESIPGSIGSGEHYGRELCSTTWTIADFCDAAWGPQNRPVWAPAVDRWAGGGGTRENPSGEA